ncbi:MAG: hypothetical protein Q8930_15800 [Bacillota bacterium]|nr:hypothetical protein [Bacillota bacterium]
MPSYKKPCLYCDRFISSDANVCPYCGRRNPIILRCPRCSNPIEKEYQNCDYCGLVLRTICPVCKKDTFFADYCEHCGASLKIMCPNPKCREEQFPFENKCKRCGKKLW